MNNFPVLNIVLSGPESTGKSQLAQALAAKYNTIWSPEFARSYLERLDRPYIEEDLLAISKGQLAQQKKDLKAANHFLFSDTGLLVLKIWSDFKYGHCDPWIESELLKGHYDLFLLCSPDIPWKADPLRENPKDRIRLYSMYKTTLQKLNLPFVEITGQGILRLQNAIKAIEAFLNHK